MASQVQHPKNRSILALAQWFERQKRVLPWRARPSLYRVWVSEIMLQQTQVVTVLPYFDRFMRLFPTVQKLARAKESQVVEAWAGLGYYSRARNLHRGAQQIALARDFPRTLQGWLEIPGVGPYTAGAIVSIALGLPEPILDGNVERVLSRVLALARASGDARYKAALWEVSGLLVKRAYELGVSPSVFNQALMELGALVCSPKKPKCESCPLAGDCHARISGAQEKFPEKKAKKPWIHVEEHKHVWLNAADGQWLVARAASGAWRAGLWDFLDEPPRVGQAKLLGEVKTRHVVTRHKIERTTQVWAVRGGTRSSGLRWVRAADDTVPGSSAYKKTRSAVLRAALLPPAALTK
ncbi:MAG: A/G-specific adenine glycosylase [Oligoflexia bacterium]